MTAKTLSVTDAGKNTWILRSEC